MEEAVKAPSHIHPSLSPGSDLIHSFVYHLLSPLCTSSLPNTVGMFHLLPEPEPQPHASGSPQRLSPSHSSLPLGQPLGVLGQPSGGSCGKGGRGGLMPPCASLFRRPLSIPDSPGLLSRQWGMMRQPPELPCQPKASHPSSSQPTRASPSTYSYTRSPPFPLSFSA